MANSSNPSQLTRDFNAWYIELEKPSPHKHLVYVLWDSEDESLYVGQTSLEIKQRMRNHYLKHPWIRTEAARLTISDTNTSGKHE